MTSSEGKNANRDIEMSLRDYFAIKVLQSILGAPIKIENITKTAYRIADAMLEERED